MATFEGAGHEAEVGDAVFSRLRRPLVAILLGSATALCLTQCGTGPQTSEPPEVPTAIITVVGGETLVELGETVVLDGSESTLGAHTEGLDLGLSYFWRLDSSPAGSGLIDEDLLDPEEVQGDDDDCAEVDVDIPSGAEEGAVVVLTPDIQGLFGVTLQVSDGERLSDIEHVVLQVGGGNACPVADAGVDLVALTGVPVTLDGTASSDEDVSEDSEDGQSLEYTWHLSLTPSSSNLTDSDIFYQGTPNPVVIPDVAGTYILQLRVTDGLCTSLPDYVTLAASNGNQAPIADGGQSMVLTPCSPTEVSLDGTASYDPEGSPLQFAWSFTSVPNGSSVSNAFLDGAYTSTPSFNWDVPGIYTLELRVDDGEVESEPDYVAVQAVPSLPNATPVADAGADVLLDVTALCSSDPYGGGNCNPCGSRSVILDALGSYDPDNDALNYQWDLQSGAADILGIESQTLEVELPSLAVPFGGQTTATVEIGLTVFDCRAADDDFVTITFVCNGNP